jgi:hypothetical protein
MLSPFRGRGFYDPLSEMNRLLEQVFAGGARRAGDGQRGQLTGWSPAIDVLHQDDDLVVRAQLPGVRPEDVDITVQNGVLTISGKIEEEQEEERRGYLVRERTSTSPPVCHPASCSTTRKEDTLFSSPAPTPTLGRSALAPVRTSLYVERGQD